MLEDNPLVTVYIPTYNRVDLLKRAVNSVLNQTYKNLEIIIVDDNSIDSTHDYLKELVNQDERVKYFIKEKNSGACVSRNIAIENARGEYITGLDDDDYFEKDRIYSFVKNIFLLKEYQFIFTGLIFERKETLKRSSKIRPGVIGKSDLIYSNHVGNQVFCRLNLMKSFGKFDENLNAWQDWDCWINILSKTNGKAIYVDRYDYIVNQNDHSRITSKNKQDKILNVYNHLINKYNFNEKQKKIFSLNLIPYGVSINVLNALLLLDLKVLKEKWFWSRLLKFIFLNKIKNFL